ncbi:MAG: hypothetical protein JEZ07_08815 [Phycisphaerae bacterium]|nr:hypothetical protein [Phycisphaerae bacterium]
MSITNTKTLNSVIMNVSPVRAKNWLENANSNNRSLSQGHINKLARDMTNGKWKLTHEAIAFDPHGVLLDGQHRLYAVMKSGKDIEMAVTFNVPTNALMAIDCGKPRSVVDILKLSNEDGFIDKRHLSTLRAILGGYSVGPGLTAQETSKELNQHRQAIDFSVKHLSSCSCPGICNATTRAVIARAWYSVDIDKLSQFCKILTSGIITGNNPSARVMVLLRQFLMTSTGSSSALRREKYGKTQRALKAFIRGESLKKLMTATKELFPLPEERQGR